MTIEVLDNQIDIKSIIENCLITYHFQPIVSSNQRQVIGFEGLVRGIDVKSNKLIPPLVLYEQARHQDKLLELDRLCRRQCLRTFKEHIYQFDKDKVLFLNFDVSLLENGSIAADFMINIAKTMELDPYKIVIEVIESKVKDIKALQRFTATLKYYGFMIALDDVGVGHSNFDRLPVVKPNVVKIDRSIIKGITTDYYKQEVFKALVNLCRKIGSLVLAEGVETLEKALYCITLGADMLQGYFISKPLERQFLDASEEILSKVHQVLSLYKDKAIDRLKADKKRHSTYNQFLKRLSVKPSTVKESEFEGILKEHILKTSFIDALFILNKYGLQVTDTIILHKNTMAGKNVFYRPTQRGDDLSSKNYYYLLIHTGLCRYITILLRYLGEELFYAKGHSISCR